MATKIRLQRHGRKKKSFFHIVVADSRAPRDGRFIEKLGSYNPLTNPATIELNLDKTVNWLLSGAEPTDTAKAILSYKGAAYKKHLIVGVNKGSITQEQADAKFAEWETQKQEQIGKKKEGLASKKTQVQLDSMKAETARKEAIAAKVLLKHTVAEEAAAAAEATTEEVAEGTEVAVDETVNAEAGITDLVSETAETEAATEIEPVVAPEIEAPSIEKPEIEVAPEETPEVEPEVEIPAAEVAESSEALTEVPAAEETEVSAETEESSDPEGTEKPVA